MTRVGLTKTKKRKFNKKTGLPKEQVLAIRRELELAMRLQKEKPHIAERYIRGDFMSEIVESEQIATNFQIDIYTARLVVLYALRGYSGGLIPSFLGLIEDKTLLRKLCFEHKSRQGKIAVANKWGFNGLSEEERRKMNIEINEKEKQDKKGIYGFSLEERIKFGKCAALRRGEKPITEEEIDYALSLCNSVEYLHKSGVGIGKPNWKLIIQEVNKKFHSGTDGRPCSSLQQYVYRKMGEIGTNTTVRPGIEKFNLVRGGKPITEDEVAYAVALYLSPEYSHKESYQRGKPDWNLIINELNKKFHPNEKGRTIGTMHKKVYDALKQG